MGRWGLASCSMLASTSGRLQLSMPNLRRPNLRVKCPGGVVAPDDDVHMYTSNSLEFGSSSVRSALSAPPVVPGGGYESLSQGDASRFVQFFRQASPYIEGHRGRTFVLVIPGSVAQHKELVAAVLQDIALLHGLGVRLVVVVGVQEAVDERLISKGIEPTYVGGYRVTDQRTMRVVTEALGELRTQCEQALSKGPAIPMFRRHTKGDAEIHFEPAVTVVSGNYLAAKRRGVVHGVDFGLTGEVRFVMKKAIQQQLELDNIVLLSQMGYTAAGDVLNCSALDVGLHAAVGLDADKLFCLHLDDVSSLALPPWLSLSQARGMLAGRVAGQCSAQEQLLASMRTDSEEAAAAALLDGSDVTVDGAGDARGERSALLDAWPAAGPRIGAASPATSAAAAASVGSSSGSADIIGSAAGGDAAAMDSESLGRKDMVDLDLWTQVGFPLAVATCVISCCKGVKRAHLLDARLDGGLLLELYTRDGVGTMISADFYEGIRDAVDSDVDAVMELLRPLVRDGIVLPRSREKLSEIMSDFIVLERETKLMGCAYLNVLGANDNDETVAEVGAFCIDPVFRGSGRGDSMLDYLEQVAHRRRVHVLVLLTTRSADWFEQRGFQYDGPAFKSRLLPCARREAVDASRNAQLYFKELDVSSDEEVAPLPGSRIGI